MPIQKLILKSGITTEATQTLAMGTWAKSQLIRFRDGFLEKQFGWSHLNTAALTGVCRALAGWTDFNAIPYIAAGSNRRLEIFSLGTLYDITPSRVTDNPAVNFSTVINTKTVTIIDAGHGATTSDEVYVMLPVAVGGLVLYGPYQLTVVDANTYTIQAASNATSTVNNAGAVPSFTSANASNVITVTLAGHGLLQGQFWNVDVSTTIATVVLNGQFIVNSIISSSQFTILGPTNANAVATVSENAGNARLQYLLAAGSASAMAAIGWGSGTYGSGTWGNGSGAGSGTLPPRIWSLDNFQTDLLAVYINGPLYKWSPPTVAGFVGNRATTVGGQSPLSMTGLFVSMPALQAVAFGAEALGTQDPLLVRYSDAGGYTTWVASITNQAGSYRLSRGSRIVGARQGPLAGLIWTDTDLWQMQYIGLPFIYSFFMLGSGCGLVAIKAHAQVDHSVYWMSLQGFFSYTSGNMRQVPCSVWDTIFQDIDRANVDKIFGTADSSQREVSWFYPSLSGGTGEIDSYIKLNVESGDWDYGALVRTAGLDQNVLGSAIEVDGNGVMQQFSTATYDADGSAMVGVMAETGFIDLADGDQMVFLDQIMPDFKLKSLKGGTPTISLTVKCLDQPLGVATEYGPFAVTLTTKFISPRARARQMALRINCDAADTWFRLGAVRVRTAPDGKMS